jgi:hypothetical protein
MEQDFSFRLAQDVYHLRSKEGNDERECDNECTKHVNDYYTVNSLQLIINQLSKLVLGAMLKSTILK